MRDRARVRRPPSAVISEGCRAAGDAVRWLPQDEPSGKSGIRCGFQLATCGKRSSASRHGSTLAVVSIDDILHLRPRPPRALSHTSPAIDPAGTGSRIGGGPRPIIAADSERSSQPARRRSPGQRQRRAAAPARRTRAAEPGPATACATSGRRGQQGSVIHLSSQVLAAGPGRDSGPTGNTGTRLANNPGRATATAPIRPRRPPYQANWSASGRRTST